MEVIYFIVVLLLSFVSPQSFADAGEPFVYFPPFELRAVSSDNAPFVVPVMNSPQQGTERNLDGRQRGLLHTVDQHHLQPPEVANEFPSTTEKAHHTNKSSVNVHDLLTALGVSETEHEEKEQSRASGRDYEYPPYPPYPHTSYGYAPRPSYPPGYGSWPPPSYHDPAYAYVPPPTAHNIVSSKTILKPLADKIPDLVKPVATKVASKVSGLIGLVLALLTGSAPDDLELKGFKDIVINGIVKPLLIAKGGLKSLISKLTVPVISLLLINLEVLITVWWLWEDCSEVPVHPPVYQYPKPSYNYNPYR